jgi:hypothetical protein
VAGIGTGGTITGVGQVLKERKPGVQIIAVEPGRVTRSSTAAQPGPHKIQGIGANFVPEILDTTVYDEVIDVNAGQAVEFARKAATEEGLLVGLSPPAPPCMPQARSPPAPRTPARRSSSSSPVSASVTSPPSSSRASSTERHTAMLAALTTSLRDLRRERVRSWELTADPDTGLTSRVEPVGPPGPVSAPRRASCAARRR